MLNRLNLINTNIGDQVYGLVKGRILEQKFKYGSRIDVNELQNWLKVSETPIRRALDKLSYEGLLENVPQKGYYFIDISREDIIEVYELRKMLELYAVEDTIKYINIDEIHKTKKEISKWLMQSDKTKKDKIFYELSREVHMDIIVGNSPKKRVKKFYHEIYGIIQLCQHFTEVTNKAAQEHLAILDSLLESDVVKTKELLSIHIESSKEKVLKNFRKSA